MKKPVLKNNSNTFNSLYGIAIIPSSEIQFWTFLIFEIPSFACTIFLLFHLLTNRQLRQALHNHVIILLLLLTFGIEVFDNPLSIDAHRYNGPNSFQMTQSICLIWWFVDFGLYGAITVFLAWSSIERHILIFHYHQLLRTARQRFCLHYLPLILICIYIFGFYIGVIFFPPCTNQFYYQTFACGLTPCYTDISYLNTWDFLGNGVVCSFIEAIFSVALLVRVVWQKHRACQRITWRRHRKMAFQLLSISFLSLTIVCPQCFILIIQETGNNMSNFGAVALPYFVYLYTFFVFFLPFISLASYPELWQKLFFLRWKRRQLPLAMIKLSTDRTQSKMVKLGE